MSDLSIQRGSDEDLDFTVGLNGVPEDITGASLWFTIKRLRSDGDSAALVMKTEDDGITIDPDQAEDGNRGQASVHIDPEDTKFIVGDFYYGLQIERGGTKVELENGTITVTPDLVRA